MKEPFKGVDLPRMHSPQSVAEHEVLMSFNGDDDAVLFAEWWDEKGTFAFNQWVQKRKDESNANR